MPATLIVARHRSPEPSQHNLAQILSCYANIRVNQPQGDDTRDCASLNVGAPGDLVTINGDRIVVEQLLERSRSTQGIDALFASAAEHAGPNAVGVALSGMLCDGTSGLRELFEAGGHCLVQHPNDAQFANMPTHALRAVDADFVSTAEELGQRIIAIARD